MLGERNLIFSEAQQAVYELDDLAAYVWTSRDAGMTTDGIVRELIATGVDPNQAESSVAIAFERLRTLRSAIAAPGSSSSPYAPAERLTRLAILIAGVTVQLHLSQRLVADAEAVFGSLTTESRESDLLLCACADGNTVHFFSPGQPDWSCERPQFIPLLKAQIIESVLACARYEVALHAAALVRGDQAVLLVGSPGAGKTTLAIALAKAGYGALADDVVLLDEAGLVTGVSLPFAAKASSWPLLTQYWPGIADQPSHCRPDGQSLCYIPPDPVADPRPRRIRSVVILDRQNHARARIEQIEPACALFALIKEGATRDKRLGSRGFTALVEGLREARCCRLTYSDLMEGAEAVSGFHP